MRSRDKSRLKKGHPKDWLSGTEEQRSFDDIFIRIFLSSYRLCTTLTHIYNYWKNDFNTHGTLSLCDIKSNDMWHLEKVTSPIRIH